jgi:tripartite-type tricarboxylate transporter receptor subunit TctC
MTSDPAVIIQVFRSLSTKLFLLLMFFAVVPGARPLYAQAAKNFYEGKVISYYVGSTAGGGNDITSRHIARHFEKYIPGKPRIDIINKPGAGGLNRHERTLQPAQA